MAAQAWKFYNRAKNHLGQAQINLLSGSFRMVLAQSSSNFATATLNLLGSLTNRVASGNGYNSTGKALASITWTAGASAGVMAWDCADLVWTATGGTIANIKAAVIYLLGASAGATYLVCRASLTSSQFTLSTGNTLTIQINASGIVTLT